MSDRTANEMANDVTVRVPEKHPQIPEGVTIKVKLREQQPATREELSQRAIDCLNEAFRNDPAAMQSLIANRIPCNQGLADHPHIVVSNVPTLGGTHDSGPWVVGMLGVICGLFNAMGLPQVGAKFSDPIDEEGRRRLEGFCFYERPDDTD